MNRDLKRAAQRPILKDLSAGIAKEFAALRREVKALGRKLKGKR